MKIMIPASTLLAWVFIATPGISQQPSDVIAVMGTAVSQIKPERLVTSGYRVYFDSSGQGVAHSGADSKVIRERFKLLTPSSNEAGKCSTSGYRCEGLARGVAVIDMSAATFSGDTARVTVRVILSTTGRDGQKVTRGETHRMTIVKYENNWRLAKDEASAVD